MDTFLTPYVVAVAIGVAGAAFMALASGANRLLVPRVDAADRTPAPDVEPDGAGRGVPNGQHYAAAVGYAVVLAGVAYLFPWAAIFAAQGFGFPAVAAMAVFGVLLAAAAAYAVRAVAGTWR